MKNRRRGDETYPVLFFRGIALRDYPTLLWLRLTVCRKHGHLFVIAEDYCNNCEAPWMLNR